MNIIYIIAWYLIGCLAYIYWWTRDYDFTAEDALVMVGVSTLGPLVWVIGWFIHGRSAKTPLIKRRSRGVDEH